MGIFTVPVHTRNTRIYVSASQQIPNVQLTLFKNEVRCHFDEGFLILPVPYPHSVRFYHPPPHPMTSIPYLEFLNEVEGAFDFREHRASYNRVPPLPSRHNLGQYEIVNVIDSIEHLCEMNDYLGMLPSQTLNELAEIYSESYWGFIILRVLEGEFVYEPLCYSHRMIRDELFVPALTHIPRNLHDAHIQEESNLFDDRYFINGTELHLHPNRNIIEVNPTRMNRIPWRVLPTAFQSPLRYFLSETRRGPNTNRDLFYPINRSLVNEYHSSAHRRQRFHSEEMMGPPAWW
jgi:hypothetical protein